MDTKKAPAFLCKCLNQKGLSRPFPWSHLGLNQGPPDYESGATNQLSYGTVFRFFYFITASCRASSFLTTARLLRQSSLAFLVLKTKQTSNYSFLSGIFFVGLRTVYRSFTQVNSLLPDLSASKLPQNKLQKNFFYLSFLPDNRTGMQI